jgi:glutamine synthetase
MSPPAAQGWAQALATFEAAHPDLSQIDIFVFDTAGQPFGKRIPRSDFAKIGEGVRLSPASLLYDARGNDHAIEGIGVADGDPDATLTPIVATLAPTPWIGPHAAQVLGTPFGADGAALWYNPRLILSDTLARFKAETGLTPVVACEYEFHLTGPSAALTRAPAPRTGAAPLAGGTLLLDKLDEYSGFLDAFVAACAAQAVPAGAVTAEYSPTQFEVNLAHCDDAVRAADWALLQRRAARGVARAQGLDACFMAKPFLEDAGNGLHVHISLVDGDGRNVFDDALNGAGERLRHAIGGLGARLLDHMLVFAPTMNSYRRYSAAVFSPTGNSWGVDNRSVAFRVPAQGGKARRIEHRVAGADANPYLVLAAILDGIALGLREKIDPGPESVGDVSHIVDPNFPRHVWDALDRFRASEANTALFGRFGRVYATLRERETQTMLQEAISLEQAWRV